MFKAKVIADSVGPNGVRLSSVEMTYPRFIHAEIMTHRDRARNAASSRAIPWKRYRPIMSNESKHDYESKCAENFLGAISEKCMFYQIMIDPVVPIVFGKEQKGMQTGEALTGDEERKAIRIWMDARNAALKAADELSALGVHKSICNRLTEPFMFITIIMSATEWANFFRLRCHSDAEIHFQKIAGMVREAINASTPQILCAGEWHTPYLPQTEHPALKLALSKRELTTIDPEDYMMLERDREEEASTVFWKYAKRISAGRSARVSYLTQDGLRSFDEDIKLFQRLIERTDNVLHSSPLEHVAEATSRNDLVSGCFRGWKQFRKEFPQENMAGHIC